MAKPLYYPDWATLDTTLPATGKTNKQRPKQEIREVGWDKGQIPTAEEFNWQMNNFGQWIHYFEDEVLAPLPSTYLPQNGTRITFTGDLSGSASFVGNSVITASITVLDNSHNHVSANITDATPNLVANTVVKRDANSGVSFGDVYVCGTSTTDSSTIFFRNFAGQMNGNISSSYNAGAGMSFSRLNPETGGVTAQLVLYDGGYSTLTRPRSAQAQETNAASLVRYDYLTAQINAVKADITANTSASKTAAGWWKDENTGMIFQWGYGPYLGDGEGTQSFTFPIAFPSTCLMVVPSIQIQSQNTNTDVWSQVINWSRTGTNCQFQYAGGDGNWQRNVRILYWAIGY